MANIARSGSDPFDDFFRGFFVRPVDFGKVSRSFQLGQDVDESKSAAKFTDGVLELTLPKKAASAAKRLTID